MKLLRYLLGIPFAIAVIALSVANRSTVTVRFSPLPYEADIPLYLLLLCLFLLGVLVGGSSVYVSRIRRWWKRRRAHPEASQTDRVPQDKTLQLQSTAKAEPDTENAA